MKLRVRQARTQPSKFLEEFALSFPAKLSRRAFLSLLIFIASLSLSSCSGYRFYPTEIAPCPKTVSIDYIPGDTLGVFTDELIHAIASSGRYIYQREGGDITLQVAITVNAHERIGYNYDRKGKIGKLLKNLVGVEGRSTISAQMIALDSCTGTLIVGPGVVSFHADYDYADYNSIKDLSTINAQGVRQSSIAFSLGQLDTIEGAQADVAIPIYRQLAQKIVAALLASNCNN